MQCPKYKKTGMLKTHMPGACCCIEELHALTSHNTLEDPQEIKILHDNKNNN